MSSIVVLSASAAHTIDAETGAIARALGCAAPYEVVRLPELVLPEGRLLAGDALYVGIAPFRRRLRPGSHPVRLLTARTDTTVRVAFAIAGAHEARVVRFVPAALEGDPTERGSAYLTYSGLGSFASPESHADLERFCDSEQTEYYDDVIEPAMADLERNRRWCSVATAAGTIAIFSAGSDFGSFATYVGLDGADEPQLFVTDFGIVPWSEPPHPLGAPERWASSIHGGPA